MEQLNIKHINSFSKKDYLDGKIKTTPINNLDEFRKLSFFDWIKENENENSKKYYLDYSNYILGDNRKTFKKIFENPSFKTGKELEFNYHCWIVEFEGFQFLILTAEKRGTVIEKIDKINLERKKLSSIMEKFISCLIENIKKNNK